jgi:hypothetical protein
MHACTRGRACIMHAYTAGRTSKIPPSPNIRMRLPRGAIYMTSHQKIPTKCTSTGKNNNAMCEFIFSRIVWSLPCCTLLSHNLLCRLPLTLLSLTQIPCFHSSIQHFTQQIITQSHTDMYYDFHEWIVMISMINKLLKESFHRNTIMRVRKSMRL